MAVEITEEQIRPLLDLDEVRGAVEDALRLFSQGKATQPVRDKYGAKYSALLTRILDTK